MNEQWQNAKCKWWVNTVLRSTHHTHHDGVNCFQVAGVCGEFDVDDIAFSRGEFTVSTQVVLHVTRALNRIGLDVAFEFFENLVVALPHYVGQYIQTTTVRHTNNSTVEMLCSSGRQNGVDDWDCRFATVEAKALCSYVLCGEKLFECFCSVETLHDAVFLRQRRLEGDPFQTSLQPTLLFSVLNVHVLNTDGAAIGFAQHR